LSTFKRRRMSIAFSCLLWLLDQRASAFRERSVGIVSAHHSEQLIDVARGLDDVRGITLKRLAERIVRRDEEPRILTPRDHRPAGNVAQRIGIIGPVNSVRRACRPSEVCGHAQCKQMRQFVFCTALRPNQIEFSHSQDPQLTSDVQCSRLSGCRMAAVPADRQSQVRYYAI
jgi:hypothetical protein